MRLIYKILIIILEILAIIAIIWGFNQDTGTGLSFLIIDMLIHATIIKIILK